MTLAGVVCLTWYLAVQYLRGSDDVAWFVPHAACNLHQAPCTAELGEQAQLRLSIRGDIQPLETLPLEVSVKGVEAEAVRVEFIGRGMEMGRYRFSLEEGAPGVFRGQGQLSICSREIMPWRAQVLVDTPSGTRGSWFDFDVKGRLQ